MLRWRHATEALQMLRRVVVAAVDHDVLTVAQATAYSAMVGLFPALIVAAALVGVLPESVPLRAQLALFFDRVLPSTVIPLLQEYFVPGHVAGQAGRALAGSVVVSFVGASGVMSTLMEGFRRAHDLPLTEGSFWPRRLRSAALVPLSLLPMSAASVLVMFGHLITEWLVAEVTPGLRLPVMVMAFALRWTVALAGSVGIIAVIYHLGTDMNMHMREQLEPILMEPWCMLRKDWSWRASLPGAAVATGLWFASTLLFGFYVTRFANYSRVYGSLGAGIALMVWLYLIALSVLLGAEFNAQRVASRRDHDAFALLWKIPGLRRYGRTGRIAD